MRSSKIFNVENLHELTDIVHDRWFMIDEVKHDVRARLLELPFYNDNPYRQKELPAGTLIFKGVKDVLLIDKEQVGSYDFNKVVYDSRKAIIRLETNIPLTIEIAVEGPDFEVIHVLQVAE
jgi:hypothetical protein